MTVEETITLVKECGFNVEATKHSECEKVVLSALEKQIPKKPNKHGFDPSKPISSVSYTCPICDKHIGREDFCKHCGQALSWGSEDKAK